MKKIFYNLDYKKILLIFIVLIMITSLSGCTGYDDPLNGFSDEGNVFEWLLVWPLAWVMNFIGSLFNDSFAIGLIFTTILVRFIGWPIYMSTTKQSNIMQEMQPDMQRIQNKYAGKTDQHSKQKMSQEMSALYKKYGFNPLGCLGILFQFPIFQAMYTVIRRITVEGGELTLSNYTFLGFDLATVEDGVRVATSITTGGLANQIFCGVLTFIVGLTMFLQQYIGRKKSPHQKNIPKKVSTTGFDMESQMKMMMWVMPIMFAFIASQDAGMALYWVIGNTCSLLQAIYVKKRQAKKIIKKDSLIFDPSEIIK